jgi:hypothetical protein
MAPTDDLTGARVATRIAQAAPNAPVDGELVGLTCAPAALFADVVVVRSVDHRAVPGAFGEGLARCPAGYFALGGGGFFQAFAGDFRPAARNNAANTPSADGTAWVYDAVAPAGANAQVTVVQCAPRTGRDLIVQAGTLVTAAGATIGALAPCPPGYEIVSGGFYVSNVDGSVARTAEANRSTGVGPFFWQAYANGPVGTKVVALAQCLR